MILIPRCPVWGGEFKKISEPNLTCCPGSLVVPDRFFRFWSSGTESCDCSPPNAIRGVGSIEGVSMRHLGKVPGDSVTVDGEGWL